MPNDVINTVTIEGTTYDINGGGHTIKNPAGTAMTQRSNLQFVDLTISDDSTNDATKVESVHVIQSESELNNLPDGLYMLDEDEETVIDGNLVGYDNTDSGLNAENVQDAIDELGEYIGRNKSGTAIDITSYASTSNMFKIPCDGYVVITSGSSTSGKVRAVIRGSNMTNIAFMYMNITNDYQIQSLFVKKGMYAYLQENSTINGSASFYPLE